ncbi:TPA: type II CRISPR RNA-guided endonuclease Cas9 [Elizabethkingia anophelis]|uniref:type II CRISPR RNA-guided endonuclease Cas9 n=1 Tax=Elizabethkingia anophelis TaxID=1117645 RepID=UPI00372F92E6
MVKNILGLDLGTNSIGWALIKQDFENKQGEILGMGSRIIPMSQDILGDFGKGNSVSQTAERTKYRSVRRLRERFLLRRERLHRVLNVLDFLPEHYASQIDFNKRFGKFKEETEPKLAYSNDGFIFKKSFEEMIPDFKTHQPQLLENNKKVPYDWTIYYLRNKALSHKIEKEELAWILLNFNQKRGYYQLRGEDFEEEKDKVFVRLKVDRVVDSGENVKGRILYDVYFENGWKYEKQIVKTEDWIGRTKEFIVTESILKNGDTKRTFKTVDSEKDWIAIKTKTEQEIDKSHKTVGAYIYETLLQNPKQKIKGKLVRTIERKFYKAELKKILEKQKEFHPELRQDDLYNDCVRELYKNNEAHQLTLSKKDFVHLFMEDIIFYQRPLRSQKSSISNCTLEFRKYKDENGTEHIQYLKALPKSNPYYQEFRIWQWMYNLNIYKKEDDTNVTKHFLNTKADFESLFEFLNNRKEVDQKALLKHFKLNDKTHRWKYVEDKKYPCNETKTMISERLKKVENISDDFLTREIEQKIWHIIYSVNDKVEYEKALKSFAGKNNLEKNSFFEAFKKFPPFKSEYGAFSEKAIKKLLPLMRLGKHWDYSNISEQSKSRIQKIITGEYDENIKDRVREKAVHLTKETDFQGLQLWLAQYIVYGRHSEAAMLGKWNSADDLEEFLKEFKQHSLRNPIVEQVITETLRVIKDIWVKYGNGAKDFFNEIHIELGREMKLPAEDRKKITSQISENENTNLRIKALLAEMMADSSVENVRPFSPMQQEILKIYEDGVLNSDIEIEDDILKISKTAQPSPSDLKRYKLWLEQKYKSPYTGQIIPLNKLFTPEYEIEHIIPQSRYFDDSFSNKVICESAVNKLKDNFIGLGFIKQFGGTIVECGNGKSVTVLKEDQYEDFVKKHYANNRSKRNKLLLEDIPEKMIERQMNDTRYISKYISGVLSI